MCGVGLATLEEKNSCLLLMEAGVVERAAASSSRPPCKQDLSFSHRIGIKQRDGMLGAQWVWTDITLGIVTYICGFSLQQG